MRQQLGHCSWDGPRGFVLQEQSSQQSDHGLTVVLTRGVTAPGWKPKRGELPFSERPRDIRPREFPTNIVLTMTASQMALDADTYIAHLSDSVRATCGRVGHQSVVHINKRPVQRAQYSLAAQFAVEQLVLAWEQDNHAITAALTTTATDVAKEWRTLRRIAKSISFDAGLA